MKRRMGGQCRIIKEGDNRDLCSPMSSHVKPHSHRNHKEEEYRSNAVWAYGFHLLEALSLSQLTRRARVESLIRSCESFIFPDSLGEKHGVYLFDCDVM